MKKIKVLVVDDSALMRRIISDMIREENDMEAIGTARNGLELLDKLSSPNTEPPDIITLDVEMPKMDGITALREMKSRGIRIPVIVLSSISEEGKKLTMECLEAGAFDFLPKPSGTISLDISKVKNDLVQKVRVAYNSINPGRKPASRENKSFSQKLDFHRKYDFESRNSINAIAIGASTGGPKALYSVITKLPENLAVPVFVVQHMPKGFTRGFAERLNLNSHLKVVEAEENMTVSVGTVYVAPGGFHMEVGKDRHIHLNTQPAIWGVRPAVDKLFFSASEVYGRNMIGVVLTGMGRDGADGIVKIKDNGGITISEDESTCTIYGMPKSAYETGKVDMVLRLDDVADELVRLVDRR